MKWRVNNKGVLEGERHDRNGLDHTIRERHNREREKENEVPDGRQGIRGING